MVVLKCAVIVDVEPTTAVRQAKVTAAKTMITRTTETFGLEPERLAADTGCGSAKMLAWLVHDQGIEPHVPVFDKSERKDGTFARNNFQYDHEGDVYTCPAGTKLRKYRRPFAAPRIGVTKANTMLYRASKFDCAACALKPRCCPNTPARKVPRSSHEGVSSAEPPLDEHSAAGQGSPVVLLDQVREPPQCTAVQTGKRARYSV